MNDSQPYIGANVTLVSSLDVRYEGVLFTIDPNESTVALQNVTCLGTEGRQHGDKAIEPSDQVYEFIIFRGENIKSINIAQPPEEPEQNELNDPSILKIGPKGMIKGKDASVPELRPQSYQPQERQHRLHLRSDRRYAPRQGGYRQYRGNRNQRNRRYDRRDDRRYERRQDDRRRRNNNKSRANPGDAKFLMRRENKNDEVKFTDDFEFTSFDKDGDLAGPSEKKAPAPKAEAEEKKEEAGEAPKTECESKDAAAPDNENTETPEKKAEPEPAEAENAKPIPEKPQFTYNPKNFFDDLDLVDKADMDFKARRKIDAQTFGSEAENYKVRRKRRRGGRRRKNQRDRRPPY